MKTIYNVLEEKKYTQQDETSYRRLLMNEEDHKEGEYTFFTNNNNFVGKTEHKIPADEWQKRCLNWFGDEGYGFFEMGDWVHDTNVIIYNYYYDFYFIYSYKKVGLGGFGEYLMIKDNKNYDVRDIETWEELSISRDEATKMLSWLSSLVNYFTDKQATLTGTVSGPEVYYNDKLSSQIYYMFDSFEKEITELSSLNICSSMDNDLKEKVSEALAEDDYKKMSKLVDDEMYMEGYPLIILAVIDNKFKILDKLIENKKCINQPDLKYKGRAVNYAVLKIEDKKTRMKYVKLFLDKKCDYNSEDAFGRNIIYDAIESKDDELFDLIYNLKGIKIDNTPKDYMSAFTIDHLQAPAFVGDNSYLTPLQYACRYENLHAVKTMATKDNINLSNMLGNSLYNAIAGQFNSPEKYKIVEYLLKMGADPNWEEDGDHFPGYQKKSISGLLEHFNTDKKLMDIMDKYL